MIDKITEFVSHKRGRNIFKSDRTSVVTVLVLEVTTGANSKALRISQFRDEQNKGSCYIKMFLIAQFGKMELRSIISLGRWKWTCKDSVARVSSAAGIGFYHRSYIYALFKCVSAASRGRMKLLLSTCREYSSQRPAQKRDARHRSLSRPPLFA